MNEMKSMSNENTEENILSEKDVSTLNEEIELAESKGGMTLEKARKGGYRPNAGRPRGSKNKMTKDVKVREKGIKERILKNVDELVTAQIILAKGAQFLYQIKMRNVAGRRKPEHILIKDPKKIKAFLDGDLDEEYCYISTQAPDNKAIDSLLDRAFGKATTQGNVNHDFNVTLINYDQKEQLPDYTNAREATETTQGNDVSSRDNNSVQLHPEGLSAGTTPSTPEVQDSGMAPSFREIQDGSEQSDTESTPN